MKTDVTNFELVDFALESSDLLVAFLEPPLQVERLVLQSVDARVTFLEFHLELGHKSAQVGVIIGHSAGIGGRVLGRRRTGHGTGRRSAAVVIRLQRRETGHTAIVGRRIGRLGRFTTRQTRSTVAHFGSFRWMIRPHLGIRRRR